MRCVHSNDMIHQEVSEPEVPDYLPLCRVAAFYRCSVWSSRSLSRSDVLHSVAVQALWCWCRRLAVYAPVCLGNGWFFRAVTLVCSMSVLFSWPVSWR